MSRKTTRGRARIKSLFGKLLIFLTLAVSVWLFVDRSIESKAPESVVFIKTGISGIDAVEVDPTLTEIRPVLAKEGGEYFDDMIDRLKPKAAINGTFYDADLRALGDILIDGKVVNNGHYPNAFAVANNNKLKMIRGTKQHIDWSGCRHGIAAGPRIVHNGKVDLNPNADGFSQRSLVITATRTGVGITKGGKLLMVTTSRKVTLNDFAEIMVNLGAVEALNFDGGGARGLMFNDKIYANPYLRMSNILVVYEKQKSR